MNRPNYLLFKQCSKCGEILHVSKFYKNKGYKYGVMKVCKECHKNKNKEYRENNKEYLKEYHKQHYEENKDRILERNKEYYEENKDRISEKNKEYVENNKKEIKEYKKQYYENHKNDKEFQEKRKQYREENRDYCNEYSKQWRKDNPEKVLNYNIKRREKENYQGNGINEEQWYEMMEFFNWRCAYSDEYIGGDSDKRTIDHIVALDNRGEHEVWNCVPCYASYNYSKHTKNMLDWYLQQEYFDIERLTKIYEWRIYAYWKWKDEI